MKFYIRTANKQNCLPSAKSPEPSTNLKPKEITNPIKKLFSPSNPPKPQIKNPPPTPKSQLKSPPKPPPKKKKINFAVLKKDTIKSLNDVEYFLCNFQNICKYIKLYKILR